jgi:hypothetical protein
MKNIYYFNVRKFASPFFQHYLGIIILEIKAINDKKRAMEVSRRIVALLLAGKIKEDKLAAIVGDN